jgi:fumarate hydratase subunit beta
LSKLKRIFLPLREKAIRELRFSDEVLLSGILYTARDKAHQRLVELLRKKKRLPIPLEGQVIYYSGPTPAPPGWAIGSCGPTTSSRMDAFTPALLKAGLKGMIGKGDRSGDVVEVIKKFKAIYFLTLAGMGALLSEKVKGARIIAYPELGPEAIYELKVKDFPVMVGIDSRGGNIYDAK